MKLSWIDVKDELPPYIFIDYRYAELVDIIRYFDGAEKEH